MADLARKHQSIDPAVAALIDVLARALLDGQRKSSRDSRGPNRLSARGADTKVRQP